MTNEDLQRAIQILGPKIVNSAMRMSGNKTEIFEKKLDELIKSHDGKDWIYISKDRIK